jgi:anti-sigma regulatory factor (Ser/Thr protein kinase)
MTVHALVSHPKHADGQANQVSEFPSGTGAASMTGSGSHATVSQRSLTAATAVASRRSRSRSFRATADQVREARHFLAGILGDSPLTADALACLSELATNSVLHSSSRRPGGSFTVHALLYPEVLRVEVQDEGGPWEPRHDQDDRSGRGLVIVDGLSTDWSVSGVGTGARIVWFEISYP